MTGKGSSVRDRSLVRIGLAVAILPTLFLILSLHTWFWVPLVAGLATAVAGWRGVSSRGWRASLLGFCVVASIGPSAYRAWAGRAREPVVFVVEEGFHGYQIELVEDPEAGIEVPLIEGVWVVEVPPSGRLRIKDRSMFTVPHRASCRFTSGKPCTVEIVGTWGANGSGVIDRWRFRPVP